MTRHDHYWTADSCNGCDQEPPVNWLEVIALALCFGTGVVALWWVVVMVGSAG